MTLEAGLEKLPKREQVLILYNLGIRVVEIAANVGYSRQWVYKLLDRMGLMNGKMKRCDCDEQEKCPFYAAKCSGRPGYIDLTCLFYRKNYLNSNGSGHICTCPPAEKVKE